MAFEGGSFGDNTVDRAELHGEFRAWEYIATVLTDYDKTAISKGTLDLIRIHTDRLAELRKEEGQG